MSTPEPVTEPEPLYEAEFTAEAHGTWFMPVDKSTGTPANEQEEPQEEPQPDDQPTG
jgi:hypothetical protein